MPAAAASAATIPKFSCRGGEDEDVRIAVEVERGLWPDRADDVYAVREAEPRPQALELGRHPVAAVRADDGEVHSGEVGQCLDDAAPGPSRAPRGRPRAGAACRRRPRRARAAVRTSGSNGSGNPFGRTTTRAGSTPPASSSCRSTSRSRDREPRARRDAPVDRRCRVPASGATFRSFGRNMPSGSKTYGTRRARAQAADGCADEVAVAEDVQDVGPPPVERQRKSRGDPHPAEAERRAEVMHANPVHVRRRRARARTPAELDERRRPDIDLVPPGGELTGERAEDPRPARRTTEQASRPASRMRSAPAQTLACATLPATTARPHLLVFNQYYWPGVEATAHLLTELCEALAERVRGHRDHRAPARVRGTSRTTSGGTASRSSGSTRPRSTAPRCTGGRSTTSPISAARSAAGCVARAAGRGALHDRPADGRRHRAGRRAPLPRAAARDQPGRVPGDRGRAQAAHEPRPRRPAGRSSRASTYAAPTGSSRSARR